MSRAAAERFLNTVDEDQALIDEVLSRGTSREQRIAAIVQLGPGDFSEEDVWATLRSRGLSLPGELSDDELEAVAGGAIKVHSRWVSRLWGSLFDGPGPDSGGSSSVAGIR